MLSGDALRLCSGGKTSKVKRERIKEGYFALRTSVFFLLVYFNYITYKQTDQTPLESQSHMSMHIYLISLKTFMPCHLSPWIFSPFKPLKTLILQTGTGRDQLLFYADFASE